MVVQIPVFILGALAAVELTSRFSSSTSESGGFFALLAVLAGTVALGFGLSRAARRGGWYATRRSNITLGVIGAVLYATLCPLGYFAGRSVQSHFEQKAVLGNLWQISAACDQFFLEHPSRVFVSYDEVVGPTLFIKALNPVVGEDYRSLFPLARDDAAEDRLDILLSDGAVVRRNTHEDVPPEGARKYSFPDGTWTESTWHHGLRDGPFKAFYADGSLWGEAALKDGRLRETSWLITHDGKRYDELHDGEAAESALAGTAVKDAQAPTQSGRDMIAAGRYLEAIDDLNRAIRIDPNTPDLYRLRAAAYLESGNLDDAVANWAMANAHERTADIRPLPDPMIVELVARASRRHVGHEAAGAARDERLAVTAIRTKAWGLSGEGAVATLSQAISIAPFADLFEDRAAQERKLGDIRAAERDYTSAMDQVAKNAVLAPETVAADLAKLYYCRAHMRYRLRELPGAEQDFREACTRGARGGFYDPEVAGSWLYIVQCEEGKQTAATQELNSRFRDSVAGLPEWRDSPAALLLGLRKEDPLKDDPKVPKIDHIEENGFAGLKLRVDGHLAGARAYIEMGLDPDQRYRDPLDLETLKFVLKTITLPEPAAVRASAVPRKRESLTSTSAHTYPAPQLIVTGRNHDKTAKGVELLDWHLSITNFASYPNELFAAAPDLAPCGRNTNASRTWVEVVSLDGKGLNVFCGLKTPLELSHLAFAVPIDTAAPEKVYVVLVDRRTNARYASNVVEISSATP